MGLQHRVGVRRRSPRGGYGVVYLLGAFRLLLGQLRLWEMGVCHMGRKGL